MRCKCISLQEISSHVTDTQLQSWKNLLRQADSWSVLYGHYHDALSRVFAILKVLGPPLELYSMIEFGANQQTFRIKEGYFENASIAHFMSLWGSKPITYHAFDIQCNRPIPEPSTESSVAALIHAVNCHSMFSYQDVESYITNINKLGRIPVIFSNHVLTAPNLLNSLDFWNLSGLHIHVVDFPQIVTAKAMELIRLFRAGVSPVYLDTCRRDLAQNPQSHLRQFKKDFGLPESLPVQFIYDESNDQITYVWLKLTRQQ